MARFTVGIVLAATLLAPFSASAQAQAGLSFGGRIEFVFPCLSLLGPSMWVVIVPAPFTKIPVYVWTIATLRGGPPPLPPSLDIPPPYAPLQEIAGIADIPFWCCIPGSVPTPVPFSCVSPIPPFVWPPLPGQRMQWANQSWLPSPPLVL